MMTTTTQSTTTAALKLALKALARSLSDDQAYITACTEAIAAIDDPPVSVPSAPADPKCPECGHQTTTRNDRTENCTHCAWWAPIEDAAAQAAQAPAPLSDDRPAFEAWARTHRLIGEGYGIRSESSHLPLVWMAWQAARTHAPSAPEVAAPEPLRVAAQAVIDRWQSQRWEWSKQGPTADIMQALADALAAPTTQEPQ